MRTGRYSAALPYLRRDLQMAEARYGKEDPSVAVEINNLAEANRRMGRLDEAEALYKRAIALDEKAGPKNAAGLATSLNNLALVYRAQRRLTRRRSSTRGRWPCSSSRWGPTIPTSPAA